MWNNSQTSGGRIPDNPPIDYTLPENRPDLVLYEIGTNDALGFENLAAANSEISLRKTIDKWIAINPNIRIILFPVSPVSPNLLEVNTRIAALNEIFKRVATDYPQVTYAGDLAPWNPVSQTFTGWGSEQTLWSDRVPENPAEPYLGVHLNQESAQRVVNNALPTILDTIEDIQTTIPAPQPPTPELKIVVATTQIPPQYQVGNPAFVSLSNPKLQFIPLDASDFTLPNPNNQSPENISAVVSYLNPLKSSRYQANDEGTQCNTFVIDAFFLLNTPIPRWFNGIEMSAQRILGWLTNTEAGGGYSIGWREVSAQEAQNLANQGYSVVASTPIHIAVVIPGEGSSTNDVFYPTVAQNGSNNTSAYNPSFNYQNPRYFAYKDQNNYKFTQTSTLITIADNSIATIYAYSSSKQTPSNPANLTSPLNETVIPVTTQTYIYGSHLGWDLAFLHYAPDGSINIPITLPENATLVADFTLNPNNPLAEIIDMSGHIRWYLVDVQMPDGQVKPYIFSYGHLQENALLVGNTGESQGPHLHFSVIDVDQLLQTTNQTDVIEAIKLTLTGQANDQIQANRNNILINPATIIPALENLPFQSPQAQSFFGTGLLGTIGGIINTALLSRLDPQSPIAKVINSIFSRLFPRRTTTTTPSTTTKEAQKTSEPPSQLAERAREANRRFYAQKQREFDRQQLINSITQPLRNIGTFLSHLSQTLNDTILKPLGIDFNAYLTIMAPFTERLSLLPSSFLPPTQSSVTLNLQDPELLAKQLSELNVPPGSIPAVVTVEGSTPTELTIYPSELPTDLPAATNVYPMSFEMRGIQTNPSPASTLLAQIHEALLAAPAPAILQPQTTAELEAYYLSLLAPFTDLPKDRFDDIPPRGSVIIPSEVTEVTHISRPSTTAVSTFNPADHPVFEANIPVPKSLDFSSALTSTARRLAENNITDVSSISWRDIDTQAIAEELIPELTTTHGNGVIAKKLLRDFYAAKITLEGIDTTYMPTYYFSQLLPDLQTDEPKLYELFRNALFYFLAQNFKHQDTLIKTSENLSKTVNSYTQNLIYTAQSLQQENITNVNIWAESLAAISHPPDHPRYPEAVANWKKLLLSYGSTPEKWFSDDRQSPNYNLGVRQVAESIQDGKNGFNYTFSLATVKMAESLYPQSVPSQPPSENITSQFPSTLTAVGVGLGLTGALTAVLGPEVATVILPVIGLSALAYAGLTQTSLGQTLQTQIPVLGNIPKFIKQIGQTISNVIPAPLRGFIPLGLSIPTQRFDRTNQTSIQFDPGQSYRSRLAQYVTGFPIEQPQALTDTIIADRTALLAEYSLPPTIDDPSIYQHNLLDFATTYNIPIKLYTEVPSQFQDQIPPLGHAFYDDLWGTKTVYVQSLNTLDPQELTYLAHELIHGTDDRLNSWLPPEFQEYRAYLSQPDLPSTLIGQSEKINPSNLHKFFNLVAASALADLREQLQVSGQDPNSLVTPWDENGPLSSPLSDIAIAARQTLAGNIPTHTPSLPQPLSGSEPENNPPPQGSIPSTLSALAPIGIGIALSPLLGPLVLPAVAIGAIASRFLTPRIFNTPIGKKLQSFFAPVNQFLNRRQIAVTTIAATLVGMPVLTNLTPSLDWLSQPETPTNYQQLFVESATHQAAQQYVANLSDTLINSSNHTLANADPHNIFTPWLIAEYKKYLDPTTKATITDDAVITAINQHSSSYGKLVEFWWRNYQDDLIKQFTTHAPRITDPNGNNFLEGYRISRGGTSDVFQTIDMQTGQIVVAKQFRSDNQGILKPRDLEIEYKRMQNAQRIIGNQTVQPLSFIPNSGNPIIIMESLNSTLDRYLQQYQITHGSPLPIDIVLQIGEQLADIIDKLHNDPTEKLFHGDLKPKNIFIFEENGQIRLKLGDYGVDSSEDGSMVLFTPHYIHPDKSYLINTEIGSVADNIKRQNADIYAYAVILFELLFEGYHPFIKGHPVEIAQKTPHDIMQIYNDPSEIYTFLELRQDNIPLDRFSQKTVNALNALYKKIYQDDPQKLPVNCKSFFNMFQSALTGTVPATGPLPPLP